MTKFPRDHLDFLYLALDLGCEKEFIDMVNGFIDCKKDSIESTNEEMQVNLRVSDPYVQKRRGRDTKQTY